MATSGDLSLAIDRTEAPPPTRLTLRVAHASMRAASVVRGPK